jgi:VanZ family protein
MRHINLKSFWPAIGMFVLATTLFCIPGDRLPDEDWLGDISFDKFVHIGLFAALVSLWGLPFIARSIRDETSQRNLSRILIYIVLVSIGYGIAIEFIQGAFIPNRSYSLADMVADALGCGVGGILLNKQRKAAVDQA